MSNLLGEPRDHLDQDPHFSDEELMAQEGTRLAAGQRAESGTLLISSVGLFLPYWFLVHFLYYQTKNSHSWNAQTAESNEYRDLELNFG